MEAYIIETFVALLGVCALAVALLSGARKLGVGRATGPVELCGHLPLDARRAIYLVRVGGKVLVVGAGEGGLTKLGETTEEDLASGAPAQASRDRFGDVLARVLGRARQAPEARESSKPK